MLKAKEKVHPGAPIPYWFSLFWPELARSIVSRASIPRVSSSIRAPQSSVKNKFPRIETSLALFLFNIVPCDENISIKIIVSEHLLNASRKVPTNWWIELNELTRNSCPCATRCSENNRCASLPVSFAPLNTTAVTTCLEFIPTSWIRSFHSWILRNEFETIGKCLWEIDRKYS